MKSFAWPMSLHTGTLREERWVLHGLQALQVSILKNVFSEPLKLCVYALLLKIPRDICENV